MRHLEALLLELGGELTFVGRQRRLRIGDEWYRIAPLFFHRRLPGAGDPRGVSLSPYAQPAYRRPRGRRTHRHLEREGRGDPLKR